MLEHTYQYIAFDHIIGVVSGFRFLQRKHRIDKLHGLSFQAATFTLILFYQFLKKPIGFLLQLQKLLLQTLIINPS
ncbi:hypothetical protein HanRHA438_Chr02g0056091 [Helianthus annuus]|nr:hypothetical protein HanRHA438_Chr02g0056091 [Helianthus annuus]